MISQSEVDEYSQLVNSLEQAADELSAAGHARLAGVVVGARQALRATITKAIELQRVAHETDAILSLPGAVDGNRTGQFS